MIAVRLNVTPHINICLEHVSGKTNAPATNTLHTPHSTFLANCLHSALLSTLILIINELRRVDKSVFCMHYRLHAALFICTVCTICTSLHTQASHWLCQQGFRHREGVKRVGAIGYPPSLCPTDAPLMQQVHTATCYECRQQCRQNFALSTRRNSLIISTSVDKSAECRQNAEYDLPDNSLCQNGKQVEIITKMIFELCYIGAIK